MRPAAPDADCAPVRVPATMLRMDEDQLRAVLEFAVDAAQAAGRLTLESFGGPVACELKSDRSPVTAADRQAEELIRRRIEHAYPAHGILGEEFGETPGREPARWIIDPIDGTQSFVSGVPLFSVLIGFEWQGRVLAGVIHLPALGETICAAAGLGCRWNGRPARVSDVRELREARLIVTDPRSMYRLGRGAAYERLRDACYVSRGWSDAYGFALVATGRAEIVLDPIMNVWDNAALFPVVTEAGGTFTDWAGVATHLAPEALATNGHLVHDALRLIGGP